jgi:glycolate dehydrogenase FAD-binding subunit
MSAIVLEPIDATMAASMLADASRNGLRITPRGSGTKLAWNRAETHLSAYLSLRHLNAPVQHYAGDLVATIPCGATLAEANAVLARSGQWLPIDPAHAEHATIGGIVATNDSGPRRHKYGSPRDLIIGVEMALADGRIAKAGGRVVKNVAGYDLSRLVCGSFGSLAVITAATFKLAPLPATSRTVIATVSDSARAAELALVVAAAPITPSAIEIEAPTAALLIRFETTERAADQMAAATRSLLQKAGAETAVLTGTSEDERWQQHRAQIWDRPGMVLKMSILPTDVAGIFAHATNTAGMDWSVAGRAALGVLLIRVNADPALLRMKARELRDYAVSRRGSLVALDGPSDVQDELRASSAARSAEPMMAAVKARFDPHGVLPPAPGTLARV